MCNTMGRFLSFCFFMFFAVGSYSQSVVINKKWLEHGVTQNGVSGMKIHVDFNVMNMKGKKGQVVVYFEYPKGTGLKDTNGKYRTKSGEVSVSENFTPRYDNSHYSDFDIFMPVDEIHMKKGKFTYYCDVRVLDLSSGNFLNGETYLTFDGTSQDEGQVNQNRQANKSNGGSMQTWREELGYGMFAINHGNPNGARQRTIYRACSACRGTVLCGNCHGMKMCTICNGRGGIVTAGYGNFIPCMACGRTGRCGVCHGTGKCVCANSEYPGYMPGSTIIVGPDGQVVYNSRDLESGSSSSSSSRGSSYGSPRGGTCPKCGGRKYESTSYSYAAASTAGWAQPYHNSGGSPCPYCNYKTDHYHYPCSECRGFGHK